jgi:hypothetical protein
MQRAKRKDATIVFKEGELFWDEVRTLTEGVLLKSRHWRSVTGRLEEYPICFNGTYCRGLILADGKRWNEYIRIRFSPGPNVCRFDETQDVNGQNDLPFVTFLEQVTLGHAVERVLPVIKKRFGKKPKNGSWPLLLEFAWHIRNGVFHNNMFDLWDTPSADCTWQGFTIAKQLNGNPVVGQQDGGFGVADVIALLFDLRKELDRLGINPVQNLDCRT